MYECFISRRSTGLPVSHAESMASWLVGIALVCVIATVAVLFLHRHHVKQTDPAGSMEAPTVGSSQDPEDATISELNPAATQKGTTRPHGDLTIESDVSARTLSSSNFKVAYTKAKATSDVMKLGSTLGRLLQAHCSVHQIPYDEDEGEAFFDLLREDMATEDTLTEAIQRMWTSYRQLRGQEFCSILNEAARADDVDRIGPVAKLSRAVNQLCVTPDNMQPQPPFPPDFVCYRGGGFDDRFRSFFVRGRTFRQPAFLATSFSRSTAENFMRRAQMSTKVLWVVRIDPVHKCRHVNLVTKRVLGLPDEQEYLFAPYSAFSVLSATWGQGTIADPHVIELSAMSDNKLASEDLALAPWS